MLNDPRPLFCWFSEYLFILKLLVWLSYDFHCIFFSSVQSPTLSCWIWLCAVSGKLQDPISVFRPPSLDHRLGLRVPFGGCGGTSLTSQSCQCSLNKDFIPIFWKATSLLGSFRGNRFFCWYSNTSPKPGTSVTNGHIPALEENCWQHWTNTWAGSPRLLWN